MTTGPAYAKTDTWTLSPYDDLSNAFVFLREPPGVLILGRAGWLALELCTGYPPDVAAARFAEITRSGNAGQVFERTVAGLRAQGLVRPTSGGAQS